MPVGRSLRFTARGVTLLRLFDYVLRSLHSFRHVTTPWPFVLHGVFLFIYFFKDFRIHLRVFRKRGRKTGYPAHTKIQMLVVTVLKKFKKGLLCIKMIFPHTTYYPHHLDLFTQGKSVDSSCCVFSHCGGKISRCYLSNRLLITVTIINNTVPRCKRLLMK